ncbi:cupin domain-containing protein [Parasulfitobacter algicola]|uniref:Cupin domain-containing protein n=1 Tax=Parasulfitobacter algicola TaxID=2614809 RepID=A0ABX2IUM6_9RHOB|nr:cupin domain-containing protein [Sulfitobacter algicola]NSX53753.1 cupin domain-containing protein [Sulfitobacter algicola]
MKNLAIVLAFYVAAPLAAQEATYSVDLNTLNYIPSPAFEGVETAFVYGSPREAGLYTTHARVSAGATVPPHVHNIDLTTLVTSGTAYVGTGAIYDESALVAYPVGTFFVTPAGSPHFIHALDGDFSILDHGVGLVKTDLVPR